MESPFNATKYYQRFATALAMNSHTPPTTIVSEDGMTITFKEHTLEIAKWRLGLQKLGQEIDKDLAEICLGQDFGFEIPESVPDDWTNTQRQYSWLHNAEFVPNRRGLLQAMLRKPGPKVAIDKNGKLEFCPAVIHQFLVKCHSLLVKLALYCFLTAGQTPRAAEFMDHKISNSVRPRTMFWNRGVLWLVTRRTKTEPRTRKESFIPMKCHPHLTQVMMKYLTIIRPVEQELVQQVAGAKAGEIYKEFLWVKAGERMPITDFYNHIMTFNDNALGTTALGTQAYRQIVVEIGRVFLGSEAQGLQEEDVDDVIAEQAGHTALTASIKYSANVGALHGLSSDSLGRFGMASDRWHDVLGILEGRPALQPLVTRLKARQNFMAGHNCVPCSHSASASASGSGSTPVLDASSILLPLQALLAAEVQKIQASIKSEVRSAVAEGLASQYLQQRHNVQQSSGLGRTFSVPQPSHQQQQQNMEQQEVVMEQEQDLSCAIMDVEPPVKYLPAQEQKFVPDYELEVTCQGLLLEHYPGIHDPQFRSAEQLEAVALSVDNQLNFIAVLPTGSGKSLIFTLPPFHEENKRTYVIVPNKALLDDHIQHAKKLGISVANWTTSSKLDLKGIRLVFIAMETAVTTKFNQ